MGIMRFYTADVICSFLLLFLLCFPPTAQIDGAAGPASSSLSYCAGEYSLCPDGSCSLVKSSCGHCKPGQYACPFWSKDHGVCLDSIAAYATKCKGLAGTYLDTSLSEEKRLDHLVNAVAVNLTEMTQQLVNNAPVRTDYTCMIAKPTPRPATFI